MSRMISQAAIGRKCRKAGAARRVMAARLREINRGARARTSTADRRAGFRGLRVRVARHPPYARASKRDARRCHSRIAAMTGERHPMLRPKRIVSNTRLREANSRCLRPAAPGPSMRRGSHAAHGARQAGDRRQGCAGGRRGHRDRWGRWAAHRRLLELPFHRSLGEGGVSDAGCATSGLSRRPAAGLSRTTAVAQQPDAGDRPPPRRPRSRRRRRLVWLAPADEPLIHGNRMVLLA